MVWNFIDDKIPNNGFKNCNGWDAFMKNDQATYFPKNYEMGQPGYQGDSTCDPQQPPKDLYS
jgi:hypothetical protein